MPDRGRTIKSSTYLVGGFRISIGPDSTTPGPRTHIVGFSEALTGLGIDTSLIVSSTFRGMGRFSRVKQTDYQGSTRSKVLLADFIRIGAALWSGINVYAQTRNRRKTTDLIYERIAVFQSLSSFHAGKRRAIRVVEANGILSRETARDRKVLVLEGLAAWLERRSLRKADLVVAVSAALSGELQSFARIPASKILVLPNAADDRTISMKVDPDRDSPVVGFVGSVVAWHRLDRLLRAISSAAHEDEPSDVRLEIVGDGPEVARLRELSQELGLDDRVEFVGRLAHADALVRMSHWSVGFAGHEKSSSSVMYHSPLKLYEYAALGLQIVCSPSRDASSLEDSGVAVHMYEPDSPDSLESALAAALTAAKLDGSDARQERRKAVARDHSWPARARLLLDRVHASSP